MHLAKSVAFQGSRFLPFNVKDLSQRSFQALSIVSADDQII